MNEINAALRDTVREMFALMYEHRGVGLAANQVGLPYRVFVMNPAGDPEEKDLEFVCINPEIIRRNGSVEGEEGCLSLPELYGDVRRAEQVVLSAFDLKGQEVELKLEDFPGRIVQHESDHLDGVLFIDRLSDSSKRELEPHLAEFESRFRRMQKSGDIPPDEEIRRQLQELGMA